jgi:hypothetical protein
MTLIADGPFAGMDDLDTAKVKETSPTDPPKKKRAKGKQPTARSLEHMRAQGYTCAKVEHWNAFVGRRQDLFGFIDIVCLGNGETIAIQACAAGDISTRAKKIADHENVDAVRKAGWKILVQGWRKKGNRWVMREVDVS